MHTHHLPPPNGSTAQRQVQNDAACCSEQWHARQLTGRRSSSACRIAWPCAGRRATPAWLAAL
eukprot:2326325-Prymnesium_polylepis.1